jgi:hypothetical protein
MISLLLRGQLKHFVIAAKPEIQCRGILLVRDARKEKWAMTNDKYEICFFEPEV